MSNNSKISVMARLGYIARGVVYLIIGGLAVTAAFGTGGQTTDSKGALLTLLNQPFGAILLGLVGIGLACYAVWRFIQAIADIDHHGSDAKGLAVRGGLLTGAITHVLLAVFAISLAIGWGYSSGGGDGPQDWTAWLLNKPFGQWLVGIVGVIIIGVGIAHFVKALQEKYKQYLAMGADKMRWASPISKFGLSARGVVFCIIGGFLIVAAYQAQPEEARGLGGALQALQEQPYGPWLLGVVALGLVAFGVYSFIEARYRRINYPY